MFTLTEPIVGRAQELDGFDQLLAQLDNGGAAAVEVVGEPGIGKTRLLAELASRADARGYLTLAGSASELDRDQPFSVFVDALDEYLQGLAPDQLAMLSEDVRVELAAVFPALAGHANRGNVALVTERYRSHRAVRECLQLLASSQPLVLVLDDLQWADAGSIELLGALLRRPPTGPYLAALGARPHQSPDRFSAALDRARRAGTLTRFELRAFTRAEADEFLAGTIDDADAALIYTESGGNAFYLSQLARSLHRSGTSTTPSPDVSLGDVEVPGTVASAIAEELGLLSDTARRVLEGAAVAGDPFDPELASAAAEVSESAGIDALDELLQVDVIRKTDVPRRFRFRHPLVRRAVYEATPGGWRLSAHERSSKALAERGASASARAHHIEQAARVGDEAAIALLREAAEAAALRAPASAARWLASALRLLPDNAPAEIRVDLHLERARALAATGQLEASRTALLESLRLVPAEAEAQRVKLIAACAGVEFWLGRHEEGHARLLAALDHLADAASPEAVALMLELATDAMYQGEFGQMRDRGLRALDAARPLDNRPLIATALAIVSLANAMSGAITEAETHAAEAAAVLTAMSDEEYALRLDSGAYLAIAEMYLNRYDESAAHAERAIAVGRAAGFLFPYLLPTLGTVKLIRGALRDATDIFDTAVEMARLADHTEGIAWNLFNRSVVALATGDLTTAVTAAEESVELTQRLNDTPAAAWAAVALAAASVAAGEPRRAIETLAPRAESENLRFLFGGWRNWALEVLTRAYLAVGQNDDAKRTAAVAETDARAVGLPLARAMADRATAAVALAAGDATGAVDRALVSIAACEEIGAVIEAELSRVLAGRALAQAGQRERAAAELEHAAAAFELVGAIRYREETERELRKLGRRRYRRTRSAEPGGTAIDSLTQRELQIAQLIVDDKTNPQIAAALFLSPKTVETHIRNIFHKLGVSSRLQIARAVDRAAHAQSSGGHGVQARNGPPDVSSGRRL
jgi:ATP/maltotriose-dependent transcriptional regulator MalT